MIFFARFFVFFVTAMVLGGCDLRSFNKSTGIAREEAQNKVVEGERKPSEIFAGMESLGRWCEGFRYSQEGYLELECGVNGAEGKSETTLSHHPLEAVSNESGLDFGMLRQFSIFDRKVLLWARVRGEGVQRVICYYTTDASAPSGQRGESEGSTMISDFKISHTTTDDQGETSTWWRAEIDKGESGGAPLRYRISALW
jgi:hypothetical protein